MFSGNIQIFAADAFSENATDPKHPVGTKAITKDGRIFRYAKAGGTALSIGQLQVAADIVTNHEDVAFASAGSIGDTSVSITVGATAVSANQYIGGYLTIIDDTGEARNHLITKHTTGTSTDITVYIENGLQAATTTSTTVALVRNPYSGVVVATGGTQTDVPVGVAVRAVTANYYCWLQTGGIGSVLTSSTNSATAGEPVTIGETQNGSVSGRDAIAEPSVGIAPTGVAPTSGEYNPYLLLLDR